MGVYNRWVVFHVSTGVTIFSWGFYCYCFFPSNCEIALLLGIFHTILIGTYYHIIGQLFSDGYEDFYNELLNVKWYSLNKTNRGLYYMFLMFTRKKYEIALWPSMSLNRSLVCKFVKWIYSGFTLLTSVKNNK